MNLTELIKALKRLKVETGSLACMGCGHEHNCDIHGCAIIRAALEALERRQWIQVDEKVPEPYETVIVSVATRNGYEEPVSFETLGSYERRSAVWKDGLDGSPVTKAGYERVTHWMPMPEPPEEVGP